MCVCDWTLIIFQDSLTLHYLMSTFFLVYFNTNNFEIFHVNHVSHVSAMLNFNFFFFGQAMC